jgi:phosphoribosylformimino-5-aminoimidazole carboxamide ribotide isomerase
MRLVPSLDLQAGRSRLVLWPGASTGSGSPSDRPEVIARYFVELGAQLIHLVDLDGAVRGAPANTEVIQRVARAVAVPLQLAGGIDGPEQIELAFAAGATRVVVPVWKVAESVDTLRACLRIATDWMAVGIDARPDRMRDYPWHGQAPTLDGLVAMLASEGVRRLVVSHWTVGDLPRLGALAANLDVELQLAGGATTIDDVLAARDAGADALILGETLFTGAVDYKQAMSLLAGPIPTRPIPIGVANG